MIVRLALALVPARWRAAVAHDLTEEAARRPRALRACWCAAQAVRIGGTLRWADWRGGSPEYTAMTFGRNLGVDLTLALRSCRRQPGSTAAIVLTLALGIGATTGTYAVFNAALFRPVPGVRDPDRLVSIYIRPDEQSRTSTSASFAHLTSMRAQAEAVTGIANYDSSDYRLKLATGADPFIASGATVSRDYFQTLGVSPRFGRLLDGDEYEAAGARSLVVSERFWRARLLNDPAVVGRTVWINDEPFQIVGVAAAYQGPDLLGREDLWLPRGAAPVLTPAIHEAPGAFRMIGRLRSGASLDAARVELKRAFDSAGELRLEARGGGRTTYTAVAFAGLTDGIGVTTARLTTIYRALMTSVALLLLLACANAANLLLGRNVTRRRDLALRAAVGATRLRLMRELIVEAGLIALLAGVAGLAAGAILSGLFRGTHLLSYLPALDRVGFDWRVALFAFGATAATVLLFALAPAWMASGADVQEGLRDTAGMSRRGSWLRPFLMAAQVSISLVLFVGTALLAQTVANLRGIDLGFDPHSLLMVEVRPAYERAGAVLFQIRDDLAARIGDQNVALSEFMPLGGGSGFSIRRSDQPAGAPLHVTAMQVTSTFLAAMRMPLLVGRTLTPAESELSYFSADAPVILGESVARQLFGSPRGSLDQRLVVPGTRGQDVAWHVIGVASDIVGFDLRAGVQPSVYIPIGKTTRIGAIVLRTSMTRADAVALVRGVARRVDPSLPIEEMVSAADRVDAQLAQERLLARLGGIVAAIAAVLALAGVYAVMAFFVAERTREFGIRRALGASTISVAHQVLRRVIATSAAGLVVGAGLAALVGRSLAVWLYGVTPLDPPTMIAGAALLLAAALAAAAIPARRATQVEVTVALRID